MKSFIIIFCYFCLSKAQHLPILFWHAAGSSYCSTDTNYTAFLKLHVENVYIKSVKMGFNEFQDYTLSLTIHPFIQIEQVYDEIKNDPIFKNGYNAIGHSQGGLMLLVMIT
jgi:Palmitoyl protein thioesterase